MLTTELLALGLGIAAILHCLYMASQLLQLPSKKSNHILGLLLVALSVRIGKSLLAWVEPDYIYSFSVIGLCIMATIGPLLRLYTLSLTNSGFTISRKEMFHFIPVILIGIVIPFTFSQETLFYGYAGINLHLLIYLSWATWRVWSNQEIRADDVTLRWLKYFIAGLFILSLAFIIQIFIQITWIYLVVTLAATVILYALSLLSRKHSKVFLIPTRKPNVSMYHFQLAKKIESLFQHDEIYKDPLLTLSRVAAQLKCPHYEVSQAVNSYFNKTFPELLITYRIKKAELLLANPQNEYLTIEAVAYECGFSSLSAFYTGFKKINKLTPAQFRDKKGVSSSLKQIS